MIPPEAFEQIRLELERQPLELNAYRKKSGTGRSQAFGVVGRRCLPDDYSRNCWRRPKLYSLLLDFGQTYVTIPWNAITVNQNYQAGKHYDKHNVGDSFLVAFGDFTEGNLLIHEGDLSGSHNIRYNPIIANFSEILHSVDNFQGNRYSLVYYQYQGRQTVLPPPSVKIENDQYVFYRGDQRIDKKEGLPHPLRGKKKSNFKRE